MALKFGSSETPTPRMTRRPPPNYFSSTVRRRLFVIVAAILLSAGIFSRLDHPKVRSLLGIEPRPIAGGPPLTDEEYASEDVDTRLANRSTGEGGDVGPVIRVTTGDSRTSTTASPESSTATAAQAEEDKAEDARGESSDASGDLNAALESTWRDAWIALLRDCPTADVDRLYDRLRAARGASELVAADDKEASAWKARVAAWDVAWQTYVKEARAGLDATPDAERPQWNKILDEAAASWLALWRPLLETLGEERPESPEMRALVALLQEVADERSLAAIQDDTIWRGSETNVWFRLVERIRETPPETLRRESLGPTGFLQLFKQPEHFRGQVVTVRGTVRLAYRVDAPPNVAGVKEYTLLWLHPAGGPSSPIVVYALETPAGFPEIRHRDRDRGTTTLHEEVEITGFFFKRFAYEGRDGIHVAPLILAQSPRWQAAGPATGEEPNGVAVASAIMFAALLAVGLVVFALRNTKRE